MRIAFVSDIHGNLPALEAVVADIRRRSVDQVINLGDSLSGPLLPLETARYLMAQDWLHLAGNHERQLLTHNAAQMGASDAFAHARLTAKEWAWLASLPATHAWSELVFLCHGTPTSDLENFLETATPQGLRAARLEEVAQRLGEVSAELIACGHTHLPRVCRTAEGQWIVNPGSVGLPAYAAEHPYPYVVENFSPDARYAIVEYVNAAWHVSLLSVPYDHEAMAQLAQQNQRPDWAHALRYGVVEAVA